MGPFRIECRFTNLTSDRSDDIVPIRLVTDFSQEFFMKRMLNRAALLLLGLMLVTPILQAKATGDSAIASRTADVEGVQLHYLTMGEGPTVILLHGYAETSRMWRPIMPLLAKRFTVIAPDLPGIGDSAIPVD